MSFKLKVARQKQRASMSWKYSKKEMWRWQSYGGINGGGWSLAPPTAMRIVSWNAQGMGNDRAFREAQKILQLHKPQIMFLRETKLLSGQMQEKGKA